MAACQSDVQVKWITRMHHHNYGRGFTLIELLFSLFILILLASWSTVNFSQRLAKHRTHATIRLLEHRLIFARHLALTTGKTVNFCPKSTWSGEQIIKQGEEVLRVFPSMSNKVVVDFKAFGTRDSISFYPDGTTGKNGTFIACSNTLAAALIITKMGRTRLAVDQDGDGVVEDSDSKPIRCS